MMRALSDGTPGCQRSGDGTRRERDDFATSGARKAASNAAPRGLEARAAAAHEAWAGAPELRARPELR